MIALGYLLPAALLLGFFGLVCFLWALRSGQFEDLDGAAHRALHDASDDRFDRPRDEQTAQGPDQRPSS